MPAFRFTLAPLLERQIALATAKRNELLRAERAASLEVERAGSLEARFRELSLAFADDARRDPSTVRQTLLELELVRSSLAAAQTAVDSANALVRDVRQNYAAARSESERLQTLHDRAYAAFLVERDRREAAEHDEANARGGTLSP